MRRKLALSLGLFLLLGCLAPGIAQAGAVLPGVFGANNLAANDDGSTGLVAIGFSTNFFGTPYTNLYVNNNGNVTFGSPLGTFTPYGMGGVTNPMIAPFFADVDTRTGNLMTYGTGTYSGRSAFGVNWIDVGYFSNHTDKLNSFQLVLIDRSDVNAGDFDILFNYDKIQWETGDASGATGGLGGTSAAAGYSNGTGVSGTYYELTGSLVNGALLDGGVNSLVTGGNTNIAGRYLFEVRNGVVTPAVPLPPSALLLGSGLLGLVGWRRFRKG